MITHRCAKTPNIRVLEKEAVRETFKIRHAAGQNDKNKVRFSSDTIALLYLRVRARSAAEGVKLVEALPFDLDKYDKGQWILTLCARSITSGAALGERFGEGSYRLFLNTGEISIDVEPTASGRFSVALQSPETSSTAAPMQYVDAILALFNFTCADINDNFPVRFASAGARHLIIVLNDRATLAKMEYQFEQTRSLMLEEDLATISLLWPESKQRFHSRNPFAAGGVYEDPATGAAAAALAGYLRGIVWQGTGCFEIIQGEDMGRPSRLLVEYTSEPGASVKVAGETRHITETSG